MARMLTWWSFAFLRFVNDFDQLNLEIEGGVRRNRGAGSAFSIGEIWRDVELPFRALFHQLKRFGPSGNDLSDAESGGGIALVRAVEFGAVGESSRVMCLDGVRWCGNPSRSLVDHLVTHSRRKRDDSGLLAFALHVFPGLALQILRHVGVVLAGDGGRGWLRENYRSEEGEEEGDVGKDNRKVLKAARVARGRRVKDRNRRRIETPLARPPATQIPL